MMESLEVKHSFVHDVLWYLDSRALQRVFG